MSQSDFVTRGQALVTSGQYQEAVKVCRLGLLGRPTTVEGRVVLGQALLALKRYDEVLAEMRVALELDHASQAAQVLKAEALLRKGDGSGAFEALSKLRGQADAHVSALLGEAERLVGRSPPGGASAPAARDAEFAVEPSTKLYPPHLAEGPPGNDPANEYTRPAMPIAPGTKRSTPGPEQAPVHDATPPPAVLAVGDRSGTLEVDPERDGFELRGTDDEIGDVVGPPVADGPDPDAVTGQRPAHRKPGPAPVGRKPRTRGVFKEEVSTVELQDDEMIELGETMATEPRRAKRKLPGPGTAVRNAVKMPSGPIDQAAPAAARPAMPPQPAEPPPHLAQLIANQPHVMNVAPPPAPPPISSRSAIAAALPTAAAMPVPQPLPPAPPQMVPPIGPLPPTPPASPPPMPMAMHPSPPPMPMAMPPPAMQQMMPPLQPFAAPLPSNLAAVRPTIALNPAPAMPPMPPPGDPRFNGQDGPAPAWARATVVPGALLPYGQHRAAADEATRQPHELDPQIAAMIASEGSGDVPAPAFAEPEPASRSQRTGTRRGRSRLQILVWVVIGAAVIGGGVLAGFQIRALRLRKQIAAARDRAVDVAKADTWQGWIGARDSLYSIAQASPTDDNKAALARVRGLVAYEFGDGTADAKAAVDRLAGRSGVDADLAIAYVALAQSDAATAREAADRAQQAAPEDPAALYVSGQTAMLAGDLKSAVADLRRAFEREARPLYAVGLARALGASAAWDDAIATVDRAGDNPAAVIAKGSLLATSGRIVAGQGAEIRAQLGKLIAEGAKPSGDQGRTPSPAQVALADLALAQVEFARNDAGAARAAIRASLEIGLNEQRFAEAFSDTLYAIGDLDTARKAATRALELWPTSRRARITLAQIWLALAKPAAALELFGKGDAASSPRGQVVRGQARLATGDTDGARADFDGALKKLAGYEPALIARAWLDLQAGELDDARQRIEAKFNPKTATPGMVAIYAAILRASGEPASRDKAKSLLERVVTGAPGPETARAQLELARLDRDLGDIRGARAAYADASKSGSFDARLESALLQIDDHDPRGGRDTLEQLVKEVGNPPPALLMLETARARMLVGDHAGAAELLAAADKAPGVVRWQLDRERGRLALRKNDTAFAAQALVRALDACGSDLDTFMLAADTLSVDDKQPALAQKLKALLPTRLKGRPESDIIAGKLFLASGRRDDADKVYKGAREALVAEKASTRRLAQADFGRAAIAYDREDDPNAVSILELVMFEDPSLYGAYLFAAEIARPKKPKKALELAQQAASYNPDSLDAWKLVGTLAAQLNKAKLLNDKGKLLNDAIARVGELAPGSEALRQLQSLR